MSDRTYIVEKMPVQDPKKQWQYMAFRQDPNGWASKNERTVGYGNTIREVILYMQLHYPGSQCVGFWPPEIADAESATEDGTDSSEA